MRRIINFERILCPVAQSHETDEGLKFAIAFRSPLLFGSIHSNRSGQKMGLS